MVRPVFQLHGGGGGIQKGGRKEGNGKEMEKIFPLNRLCHSREWKTMRKFSKIIAETFGGEGESRYLCTRNRERCGKSKKHEKNFMKNLEDRTESPYLCNRNSRKRATRKEVFERFTYTTSKYKY